VLAFNIAVAIGAALGAFAFVWDARMFFAERARRQYADDLRAVLLKVQTATIELRYRPKPREWTQEHVLPLREELKAVAERMPDNGPAKRLFKGRIQTLASLVALIDSYAAWEDRPVTNESGLDAQRQVNAAAEAHAYALRYLSKV
jgi:hypothetical protein